MSLPALKRIFSNDRVLNQVQEAVNEAIRPLLQMPIASGRLIEDIALVSGTAKSIEHKLNRESAGWIVVKKNANVDIWESTSSIPTKTLVLNASGTVTISLWVF